MSTQTNQGLSWQRHIQSANGCGQIGRHLVDKVGGVGRLGQLLIIFRAPGFKILGDVFIGIAVAIRTDDPNFLAATL